jgi:hypothetical protein
MATRNPPLLAKYSNGNCRVELWADGTKTREWEGEARPEFPESMDLKITDWCDGGCLYCHEKSTVAGKHARLDDLQRLLSDLPAGVEIAMGGGDTVSFPQLEELLVWAQGRGLVMNMTVNAMHLYRHAAAIRSFRERKLIYGLGISYGERFGDKIDALADANTVVHVIAGVDNVHKALRLARKGVKLLVLGYKRFGRGVIYFDDTVERNVGSWRYWVGPLMRSGSTVSFDNLAIEQLRIRDRVTPETWDAHYLGSDGSHTMYIDAVRMEFARSSVSERRPIGRAGVRDLFAIISGSTGKPAVAC